MKHSDGRILTTHSGSLPRPRRLLELLLDRNEGVGVDPRAFREAALDGIDAVVTRQLGAGVDIGGDGELPRIGFNIYVKDRMRGFGGRTERKPFADFVQFPGYRELRTGTVGSDVVQRALAVRADAPAAVDAIAYDETLTGVREELELFESALTRAGRSFAETFVSAASPGNVSTAMSLAEGNPAYATEEEYVFGVADALKHEYEAIVAAGHVLQIDAPDLAMERQIKFQDEPLDVFLSRAEVHVEAINRALEGIPPERVRLHVCWGNWDGPHVGDVDAADVLPIVYGANVGAFGIPCANPRHQHEWKRFRELPLPDDALLIAGVIDVTTNYVEHPEVVADRLCQFAEVIEPTRLIASTDCGFSTFAGYTMVADDVVWAKLATLARGAEMASSRLF